MHVLLQFLIPGVQSGQDSDASAQELGIAEQFAEGLRSGGKERVGERGFVASPDLVEFMRDGEDDMMMRAWEQSLSATIEPSFFGQPTALRAGPMPTGVVSDLMKVSVGATVEMATEFSSSTVLDGPGGAVHLRRQATGRRKVWKMLLRDALQCDGHLD